MVLKVHVLKAALANTAQTHKRISDAYGQDELSEETVLVSKFSM